MDNTKTLFRTHSCGELRMEQVGQTVTLAGFLENFREVGSTLGFAVLRDFYGTTQVVCETEEMVKVFKALHKETTVAVRFTVPNREESYLLTILQDGIAIVEDQRIPAGVTDYTVELTGSGTKEYDLYVNGEKYLTQRVTFDG